MLQPSRILARISRKIRKRQQRQLTRRHRQQACHFQQLEPRQLLSAVQPVVVYTTAAVRMVDADTNQVQDKIHEVSSLWFEDLAPQVTANMDTGIQSLNWKGTDITTISDQWIVQLNDNGLNKAHSVGDAYDLLTLSNYNGQVVRGLGFAGLVLIQTENEIDQDAFMQELLNTGYVDYVQPNAVLQNQATVPNDTSFINTWGLNNTGQFTGSVTDADIDAPEAWDLSTGSSSVVVGIIDTGVKYDHVDLINNMWTNPGEIAGNGIDDDGNGFIDDIHGYDFVNNDSNPMDDHGHGTHVAGTVAADGNNGIGVAGVSWNSQIMALKFMASSGSGSTSDAVRAINYATMMKTQYNVNILITCNSWGGGGYSASLYNAIVANEQAGMLFIAAAGNDSTNNDNSPHYPSNYNVDNVISVASTDWADHLSSFSNYGASSVDVAAPGSSIYSTTFNGSYGYMSGTSMATPQVAGLAALAWSYSPQSTMQQIKAAILNNGDSLSALNGKVATGKRINAYNTLSALTPAVPEADITVSNASFGNIQDGRSQAYDLDVYPQGIEGLQWDFVVNNNGTADLDISNFSMPAGFVLIQGPASTVVPGQATHITFRVDTSSLGTKAGTISFDTNDPDIATFNFNITAEVETAKPYIAISQGGTDISNNRTQSILFENVLPGETSQLTFSVKNEGYATLNISDLAVSNGFSIISDLPATLDPNEIATFVIAMDTSTIGTYTGTIVINSNADSQPVFTFPIKGKVIDPSSLVEVVVTSPDGIDIVNDSDTAYAFGNKVADTTARKTFTVSNTGSNVMTISDMAAMGDFTIVTNLPASIAGKSSATFVIEMDTTSIGDKYGSISFSSNDADESPFTFSIEGTVTAAPIPAQVVVTYSGGIISDDQSDAIDFGSLNYNDASPEITFTVTNTGDKKLNLSNLSVGGGFNITEGLISSLKAGESDTFTVRMPTNSAGTKTATISFKSNDEDSPVFNFDIIGQIIAPPDSIDLSIDWAENPDDYFIPGKKSKVLVDVTNNGTTTINSDVTVHIYASTTNSLDGSEILLGQVTKRLSLKEAQTKTNRIVIELDSEVPSDDYYIIAVVDPEDTIEEGNENNNTAVTSRTTEIAWKFGDLGDGKKTLLKLEDSDGSLVTFSLNGKGIGEVIENLDGTWSLAITGTNSSSSVSIRSNGGDGRVSFTDITIGDTNLNDDNTQLNQFTGKTVDLLGGDFIVTGTVQKLILGDITDSTITFNNSLKNGTDIILNQLTDVTINSQTGFNSFTVTDWADENATTDELNALWINKLTVKGSAKDNIVGDFNADLNLTGVGAGKYTLDSLTIKGAVNNRTWNIIGNVNMMKIDSVEDTDITIDGTANKLLFGHMLGGSLTTQAIDKLMTSIAKNVTSNADFTAALNLTGTHKSGYTLNTIAIKGDVYDTNWDVVGKVGAMVVKGNVDNLTVNIIDDSDQGINAGIDKLLFNTVDNAEVSVEGDIGYLKANSWTSGDITAETIVKSKVNGVSLNVANALEAMADNRAVMRVVNI
jgi:subtilisin family serine protease